MIKEKQINITLNEEELDIIEKANKLLNKILDNQDTETHFIINGTGFDFSDIEDTASMLSEMLG